MRVFLASQIQVIESQRLWYAQRCTAKTRVLLFGNEPMLSNVVYDFVSTWAAFAQQLIEAQVLEVKTKAAQELDRLPSARYSPRIAG